MKSVLKNVMILALGVLVLGHVNFSYAADETSDDSETSDSCVLTNEAQA